MSGASAVRQPPDDRRDHIAAGLRSHPWVQDARLAGPAVVAQREAAPTRDCALVVPSAAGVGVLRRRGKPALVSAWERHLSDLAAPGAVQCDWWLVAALPPAGHEAEAVAALAARAPVVSDLAHDAQAPSLTCRLLVPYELPIFRGHFPSTPIVPGVMQIGWAVDLARRHGLVRGVFAGISGAKFRRIVQPGMRLRLHLAQRALPEQLQFEYRSGATLVSTGRVQFGAAHA